MTPNDRRLWLDGTTARYLRAVEVEDFDTQSLLWAMAETDDELEAAFLDTDAALAEEREAAMTAAVADAVQRHLTSAEVVRPADGPVTAGMVADEVLRYAPGGLSPEARRFNEALLASTEPLPADLGFFELRDWLAKTGPVEDGYVSLFQKAATKRRMRANSGSAEYQLAARRAAKPAGGAP